MTSVKKYIESNKDRFIEELFSLIPYSIDKCQA